MPVINKDDILNQEFLSELLLPDGGKGIIVINDLGRAIIRLDWELIKDVLLPGKEYGEYIIKQGIPIDAKILNIRNNNFLHNRDTLEIIIESKELTQVPIGTLLCEHKIIIERKQTD